MKRIAALLLSAVLFLTCLPCASAAKMIQTFTTDFFSIYIPGDWIIDTSTAADYYGALEFGMMYAEDESMLIKSKMFFYSDWSQDSLWTGNEDSWNDYIEFILDDLKDEQVKLISRITAGQFPGLMVSGVNSNGEYLYGEFMINAYAFGFYFYRLDAEGKVTAIGPDDPELFRSILETFKYNPVPPQQDDK